MAETFPLHVLFEKTTKVWSVTEDSFKNKVLHHFKLKEDEYEIFQAEPPRRKIAVHQLKNVGKVEIRRKKTSPNTPAAIALANGLRPSTQKGPSQAELDHKLRNNTPFTGEERAFFLNHLPFLFEHPNVPTTPAKINGISKIQQKEMKNKKVQCKLENAALNLRTTSTQTDELLNFESNKRKNTEEIILQSKRLALAPKYDPNKAAQLMTDTFEARRNFILMDNPVVSFVKEKYPLLFSTAEVRNEIDRIFHNGKCEEFISNVEKYAPFVLDLTRTDDPLLLLTQKKINTYKTHTQKKYAEHVGSILMISSVNHEDRGFIKLSDNPITPGSIPYICVNARTDDIFFDQHLYSIYVEHLLLCEAADIKEALLCLMGAFFIFNIKYPEDNFNTYVTFEKLYLNANDTDEALIDEIVKQNVKTINLKAEARGVF